eukprot:3761000-Rhodomonas_salina.1
MGVCAQCTVSQCHSVIVSCVVVCERARVDFGGELQVELLFQKVNGLKMSDLADKGPEEQVTLSAPLPAGINHLSSTICTSDAVASLCFRSLRRGRY